jgi:ATP-binding cassette subfamily B protein
MLSELFSISTSTRLMEHAASLDLEDFEDSELQDKLERARRQAGGNIGVLNQVLTQAQDVITIASFAAGIVLLAPWLIALLIIALVPAFLGESHFSAQSYALNYTRTQERREIDYMRHTGASIETAKEVKIFGLSPFLVDRYRRLAHDFYLANRKLAVRRAIWGVALTAIGTLGYYVAYAYIAWRTVAGHFTIGDLTFLAGSFMRLRSLFEASLYRFSHLASQALYLEDLFGFFRIVPRVVSPANPRRFPVPIREGFRFENAGFRYPDAERWAVRHLDFTLRAGEVLALVGENGAGKTTLVKLLTRLYDPTEGRILLDGHDLREYDLAEVRANMGVIFQDFVRYHLLASENIAVGRIDALDDRTRIESAAHRSLADAVIEKLPEGYNQLIGRRFKSGVDLSVGEWQKIAIARAYMREAQVLILDEPTASLDARAEFEVFQRFKELSRGRTAVLISHRFSSVRMAERILVLDGGQIEAERDLAGLDNCVAAAWGTTWKRPWPLAMLRSGRVRSARGRPGKPECWPCARCWFCSRSTFSGSNRNTTGICCLTLPWPMNSVATRPRGRTNGRTRSCSRRFPANTHGSVKATAIDARLPTIRPRSTSSCPAIA